MSPAETDAPFISGMHGARALVELTLRLRNAGSVDRESLARDLTVLGRVAQAVPVRCVNLADRLSDWGHLWDLVLADSQYGAVVTECSEALGPHEPCERDSDVLSQSIAAAVNFLLDARNREGWWQDFSTTYGAADEWVTAYVGSALTSADHSGAQRAARDAWRLLCSRREADDGWGYNRFVPPDADSTAWALRLAQAIGESETDRARAARRFLNQHLLRGNAVTTYLEDRLRAFAGTPPGSLDGWCRTPHDCVTAAVAEVTEIGDSVGHYLQKQQQPDGAWNGYWWFDDAYTTALATVALAKRDNRRRRQIVQAAARWAAERIGPDGAARCPLADLPSAFATAACVRILLNGPPSGGVTESLDSAARWLFDAQRLNGSWLSSAYFAFPAPSVTDACNAVNVPSVLDSDGIFTTATVLNALTAYQAAMTDEQSAPVAAAASGV
ncbi:MAG: terpene cyclase/mutase family protein [Planctomycetaceae bacterium]|nr:terpene cyclase/mutase family protein [Planctomycetaceae bacterium]